MSTPTKKAELEGALGEFHLTDVVQFLHAAAKTGELVLDERAGRAGSVFFENGTVVHARAGESTGEEAFFSLMRLAEGHFSFAPERRSVEKTVEQSSTLLLLEGVRRSDEWGLFREKIPDLDFVPEFVPPGDQDSGQQVTLNTSEWMVLSKIDGRRSVKEIANESALSDYHVCRLLFPLLHNQLIRLRPPSS